MPATALPHGLEFQLEVEKPRGGSLLASISEHALNRKKHHQHHHWMGHLPLPHLGKAISRLPQPHRQHGEPASPRSPVLSGPDLERAVSAAATAAAGVLIAAVSAAARHLSNRRQQGEGQHRTLQESFHLPWKSQRREGADKTNRGQKELARALLQKGDEYQRSLDVRAAVQCYEEVSKLQPADMQTLAMLAKCWSDLTFCHDVEGDRERRLVNLKALEYADRMLAEQPTNVLGHVAVCVSKGRLAMFTDQGNKTKVRLAKEAQEAARVAITVDPESDVAHHVMGRWHYEMAQINPFLRTVVRLMYGTQLSPGTHADALSSYLRAQELNPKRLIHKVEAGKVLLALGRREEAAQLLEESLGLEVEDINAWHTRLDAERLLAQIHRRPFTQSCMLPLNTQSRPTPASLSTMALLEMSTSGMPKAA